MAMKNWPPGGCFCCLFVVCQVIFWLTAFVVTEARDDGLGRRNRWRAWGCSLGLVDLVCFESANCMMKHHVNVSFLLRHCGSNPRPGGTREDYHWQSHQRLAFGR